MFRIALILMLAVPTPVLAANTNSGNTTWQNPFFKQNQNAQQNNRRANQKKGLAQITCPPPAQPDCGSSR